MRFLFRGVEYSTPEKYMVAETVFLENKFQKDINTLYRSENLFGSMFLAIRRVNPKLLSWDEMLTLEQEVFEFLPAAPETGTEPEPEVPEEEWPLDPTGAGTQTAAPSVSGRQRAPRKAASRRAAAPTSSNSPTTST